MTTKKSLALTLSVAAVAMLAAGSAFADDPTIEEWVPVLTPQKTRAQVREELLQARRDGTAMKFDEQNEAFEHQAKSERSREAVKAEVIAARRSGELRAYGEDSGFDWPPRPLAQRRARTATAE